MHEYYFPIQREPISITSTIGIHVLCVIGCCLPIAVLILLRNRAPQKSDPLIFLSAGVAGLLGYGVVSMSVDDSSSSSYLFASLYCYFFVFECLVIWGMISIFRRLVEFDIVPSFAFFSLAFLVTCLVTTSLLWPFLFAAGARPTHFEAGCKGNVWTLGLALQNFHDVNRRFPFPAGDPTKPHSISWRTSLLPFIEQNTLFDRYNQNQSWNEAENHSLATYRIQQFNCNLDRDDQNQDRQFFTDYSIPIGRDTFFGDKNEERNLRHASKETSHIVGLIEACGQEIVWTEPRDVNVDELPIGINLPGKKPGTSHGVFSSPHEAGVHVSFLDGSVKILARDTDPEFLKMMLQASPRDSHRK